MQQQQQHQTETEKLYVQRWLLIMQKQYGLYNVDNRHQCLRDSRRAQYIIRPFQYARHFYGCTLCGQYHICRLHEASCVVVVEPGGQRLTCQYSGQLLRQSEALVANVYDEASDDAPLGTTNQSYRVVGAPRQCYTNMRFFGPRIKKSSDVSPRPVRKRQRNEDNDIELTTSVAAPVVVETQAFADEGVVGGGGGGGGDDDDEYGDYAACYGITDSGASVTYHSNYAYWTQHFSYLMDEQQHNDIDESPSLPLPPPLPTASTTREATTNNNETSTHHIDKEMDIEYGRPLGHIATTTTTTGPSSMMTTSEKEETFTLNVMTPTISNDIEETTSSLVEALLRLQLKRVRGGTTTTIRPSVVPVRELSRLKLSLVHYFTRLIKNIAILVYNSPVLRILYQERQSRNQRHKQRGGSGTSNNNNNNTNTYLPAAVVTPVELCLALLFNMLTKGFYHEDCCDYVVELWSPNHWLCELVYGGGDDNDIDVSGGHTIVSQVLDDRARKAHYKKDAALYTTERIERTVVHVKDALAHYQGHAMWTRNFIMTHK